MLEKGRDTRYVVMGNRRIGSSSMMMLLEGPTDMFTAAGQFVGIAIPGLTLRRPISVCDVADGRLTIVYDVVGTGTELLSRMGAGTVLDILPGLGNGFDMARCGEAPVLLGGGVGCPPLYGLAKRLLAEGKRPTVVLGFNSVERMIMKDEFERLGIPVYVATVDGSHGHKGFVTDVISEEKILADYFYACGPLPMLRALCTALAMPGQVSIESRMGCGFGVCMCCSVESRKGPKRICKDGPVFDKEDLIWK